MSEICDSQKPRVHKVLLTGEIFKAQTAVCVLICHLLGGKIILQVAFIPKVA